MKCGSKIVSMVIKSFHSAYFLVLEQSNMK